MPDTPRVGDANLGAPMTRSAQVTVVGEVISPRRDLVRIQARMSLRRTKKATVVRTNRRLEFTA
jgi:hypothetical protein